MTDNSDKKNDATGFSGLDSWLTSPKKEIQKIINCEEKKSDKIELETSQDYSNNSGKEKESRHSYQANAPLKTKKNNRLPITVFVVGLIILIFIGFNYLEPNNINYQKTPPSQSNNDNNKSNITPITTLETDKQQNDKEDKVIKTTLFHVTAAKLNLRSGPGEKYEIVEQLDKWENLSLLTTQGTWAKVSCKGKIGWVSNKYIDQGDGKERFNEYCEINAGKSPYSGEVLIKTGKEGYGELKISNQTHNEALVRLRQMDGNARYIIYVGPYNTEKLVKIGIGSYEVQIMYGKLYSRACKCFLKDPVVEVFDRKMKMDEIHTYEGVRYNTYSISLHKISGGNATTRRVDPSIFNE